MSAGGEHLEPGRAVADAHGVTVPQLKAHLRLVDSGDAACTWCGETLPPSVTARGGKYCDVRCRNAHHREKKREGEAS